MVENIYEVKGQLVDHMKKQLRENGIERMNIEEFGKLADAVKDLAESEYYCAVTDAMNNSAGYNPMGGYGYSGAQGQSRGGSQSRMGWANQYGSGPSRGYGMNGYHDHIDALRMEMQNADPQERERMAQELRNIGIM